VLRLAVFSAVLLVVAGCGGHAASPVSVTRTWSNALNAGDNEAAAKLFAKGAKVYQSGTVTQLRTLADAIRFNAALPCSGHITHIEADGDTTTATFLLGPRKDSPCDAPGATATAQFQVRHGKIIVWRQLVDVGPSV
jgi:limonene-1,2-epoxide hydrolase